MGDVINLREWRLKKETKKENVKQQFVDSLDNNKVKEKYKLNTKEMPTFEERKQRITESIKRINSLMQQLEETTKK